MFCREQFDRDYERLYKPYNGELSIDTYEPWQLKDYHMVCQTSIISHTKEHINISHKYDTCTIQVTNMIGYSCF